MQKKYRTLILIALTILPFLVIKTAVSFAAEKPVRNTNITVPYVQHEWWMLSWSDNELQCQIFTDHDGLPTGDDVFVYCGNNLYTKWSKTDACPAIEDDTEDISDCKGYYLHEVSTEELTKTIHVELPLAEAWIGMEDCSPNQPDNFCTELPTLVITGVEPLPNETITGIQGTFNDIPFTCEGNVCKVPVRPTTLDGVTVSFWAESSYGDESEHYTALVRVVDTGVTEKPEDQGWYVDVMSSRWRGKQAGTCAQTWQSFPPIGDPPIWLSTPESSQLLASDEPYMFLAGKLISQGFVDAIDCPNRGLESNGYANTCGMEKAREKVDLWQNRFDQKIIDVANETGIPAQLIKNLFAKESQFWPGVFNGDKEFGLGQLTELGADTILLWNESFFIQFCPLVLSEDKCELGYAQLDKEDQEILRGAVATNASAYCAECPAGIDLSHADFSVQLFAQILQANCEQTGQIINSITGKQPGEISTYEDLWRLTLANYHAGPGCLLKAVKAIPSGSPVTWETVSPFIDKECPGAIDYVEQISH